MLPRENGAHRIGGIDDVNKGSFLSDQSGQMLQVDLEVSFLCQFIGNGHSLHGRTDILVERVAEFGHQNLISFVGEGLQASQKAHVDAVVDEDTGDVDFELGLIQIFDGRSEFWNSGGAAVAVVVLVEDVFSQNLVAFIGEGVPLGGIWNYVCP
jgi:hypothetical protein